MDSMNPENGFKQDKLITSSYRTQAIMHVPATWLVLLLTRQEYHLAMASHLLSRLSHFKDAAFTLPKTQILSHFRLSNDANFMFPRWATHARAFCNKRDEEDGNGETESRASVMEDKSNETIENAEGGRSMSSLLNNKRVSDINIFPAEVLQSRERLLELFEMWIVENNKSYDSDDEKLLGFMTFKKMVFYVHETNTSQNWFQLTLPCWADSPPLSPFSGPVPKIPPEFYKSRRKPVSK